MKLLMGVGDCGGRVEGVLSGAAPFEGEASLISLVCGFSFLREATRWSPIGSRYSEWKTSLPTDTRSQSLPPKEIDLNQSPFCRVAFYWREIP